MAKQPNLFPLKLIVISLGFLLIGGTIWVFAAIASKAGKEISHTQHCADAVVHLEGKGTITAIAPQGDIVQITLATPPKTALITIDRCSGKILQTLTVEP